jgi:hypothetical protein
VLRNAEGGADSDKQQDWLCRFGTTLSELKKKRYSTGDVPGFYFRAPKRADPPALRDRRRRPNRANLKPAGAQKLCLMRV